MTKKCKVCGYIFKNKDEYICPECFTSRQEEMNCNEFSSDDHSHENGFFDKFERNDYVPPSTNTFKEENSFIEEQQKSENKINIFSKLQNLQNQHDFKSTQTSQNTNYERFANVNQTNYANQNNRNINYSNNYNQFSNRNNNQKKIGCLLTIIIMIFFVASFLLPIIISIGSFFKTESESDNYNSYTNSIEADDYYFENDINDENYLINLQYANLSITEDVASANILSNYVSECDIDARCDKLDMSIVVTPIEELTLISINSITADTYSYDSDLKLSQSKWVNSSFPTEFSSYFSEYSGFYYDNTADYLVVTVNVSCQGEQTEITDVTFEIDLNEVL
ncbi:MAG: hypothetical protein ACI4I6_02265 [Hominimerdicola sp.]